MKYRYTTIYSLKGVRLTPAETEKELVVDATTGLRALLTLEPDRYWFEANRSLAVAGFILRGIFHKYADSGALQERLAEAVQGIRESRKEKVGDSPALVLIAEGEIASFEPLRMVELEEFVVCLEGAPKEPIREQFEPAITAVIGSLTATAESLLGIKKISDSIVFFREDAKPVYSFAFSAGSAEIYGSSPVAPDRREEVRDFYQLLARAESLGRVQRLIRASVEMAEDSLRSFLAAWAALEILVSKVFKTYEERLFKSLMREEQTNAQEKYLERVREVMKDKYRLADKFAAIAFQLAPDASDDDLATLEQAKDMRDKLLHGDSVDEKSLPVKSVRDLACKYLRLHLEEENQRH